MRCVREEERSRRWRRKRQDQYAKKVDSRHKHLDERLRVVESAREQRTRHLKDRSGQLQDTRRQGEDQILAFQLDREHSMGEYAKDLDTHRRHHHQEQAARFTEKGHVFTRDHRAQSSDRASRAWDQRLGGLQQREQHHLALAAEGGGRRIAADGRRALQLEAKTARQIQQETSRQLQHWQRDRLHNLRQGERECVKAFLDEAPTFTHQHRYD
mmetsp:Transcript_158520/g.508549  ORF Transcript_158520/g.508549 Transcript_158520/m.508549 type:complete len:213 (-) Transcript_158520:90-728(-)